MEIGRNAQLEQRLERLEKQGRRWRAATLVLALMVGVLLTAAFGGQSQFDRGFILPPQGPEGIRARAFLLTDPSGKVQGEWTVQGGQPVLKFYGPNGKVLWFAPPRMGLKPAEAK
ncbi:MAG TPA: hypothetical protein VJQ50_19715 [Terriglobales bacterium]|nr:hypothetical protein [Terriglobales bacterium]